MDLMDSYWNACLEGRGNSTYNCNQLFLPLFFILSLSFLFAVCKAFPELFSRAAAALNEAGCHLSAAQAHERDDLEEEGTVASLIKAASCLCCFDKM